MGELFRFLEFILPVILAEELVFITIPCFLIGFCITWTWAYYSGQRTSNIKKRFKSVLIRFVCASAFMLTVVFGFLYLLWFYLYPK